MNNWEDTAHDPAGALRALGVNDQVRAEFAARAESDMRLGRVTRVDRGMPLVTLGDGEVVRAEPALHLIRGASEAANRVAVGDWVGVARAEQHELPVIEAILPRSSAFTRRDPGERTSEQVVAANIDVVFVVLVAEPELNLRRLERELVLAWDSGARPVVVVSKIDTYEGDRDELRARIESAAPGSRVLLTSGVSGEGVGDLRAHVGPGTTAALLGSSGVGKSTLVNALVGHDVQATAAVRETDGKGRHTTVAREIIAVPDGGAIIDTPGMRALALWDVADGMSFAFSDVERFAEACRFRDCAHVDEPGCAVRDAVDGGSLPARRLESYLALREELAELERRRERLAWRRGEGSKR